MQTNLGTTVLAGLVVLVTANGCLAKHAKPAASITTTTVAFHGWSKCTQISNGIVEAVIVPQIGRIMAFHFVGQPETDPLFVNKDWEGKTGADAGSGNWANFGGDKLWPSEQSNWPEYIAHTWPPDPAFDGLAQGLKLVPGGVQLTTPPSTAFGAVATRTITLRPGEARLYISQSLSRTSSPSPVTGSTPVTDGNFAPIGIWSITQTRPDGTIFLPLSRQSNFPTGVVIFDSNSRPVDQIGAMPTGWTLSPSMLIGRLDHTNSHKLGTDSKRGWIASLYNGNTVFSEHYQDQPNATFPDRGCRNEVYVDPDPTAYFEFEVLGPVQQLPAGQNLTYDVYWQLDRLRQAPLNDMAATADIRQIMRSNPKAGVDEVDLSPK